MFGFIFSIAFFIGLFIYGGIFGIFCSYLAGEKNRDRGNWFFLGLFFGIIALLVLVGLPTNDKKVLDRNSGRQRRRRDFEGYKLENNLYWVCPECGKANESDEPGCSCGYFNSEKQEVLNTCNELKASLGTVDPEDESGDATESPICTETECPICAETIKKKAKKCRFCGHILEAQPDSAAG